MWLPVLGLLVGIVLGLSLGVSVPPTLARYTAVAILAGLDSVLGAVRAEMDQQFDNRIFATGFISNVLMASLLTYLADRLGVELYLAAIVAFGVRIFGNLTAIRRRLLASG